MPKKNAEGPKRMIQNLDSNLAIDRGNNCQVQWKPYFTNIMSHQGYYDIMSKKLLLSHSYIGNYLMFLIEMIA